MNLCLTIFEIIVVFYRLQRTDMRKAHSHKKIAKTVSMATDWENPQFDVSLYAKFKEFMTKQRSDFFNSKLFQFYGKNFSINYKPNYGFSEEWENNQNIYSTYNEFQNIWKVSEVGIFLSILIMIVYTVCVWLRNIDFFFSAQGEKLLWSPFYYMVMAIQIPDAYLRVMANRVEINNQINLMKILQIIYPNIFCFIYMLMVVLEIDTQDNMLWYCVELVGVAFLFFRAKVIYNSFKLTSFALSYEYQIKAIDLLINLFQISHYIAIILYQITRLGDAGHTWISSLNLDNPLALTNYIYSLYFGTSTLLTVGYGDITPKNQLEIIVLILVQSCGIIIIAYLMNQIGHSLSHLRKGREVLEKELTLMNKMKKYYNINDELMHRARSYIIEEKPSIDHLAPEDQKKLLIKFNEQLRQEIKSNSSLAIVKNCIFFLCRWSKVMQNSVASKLQNILFSPGEFIYQPEGKERIYIIKLGKIDVYSQRKNNKKGNRHVLKTVKNDLEKEVSDNVYGNTAVISGRPVRLYAIAKQYTSAFFIQKKHFLESAKEKSTDFQYLHEIKNKIDQSDNWQALQVPQLDNSKQHFNPTRNHLFRKYKKKMSVGFNTRSADYRRKNSIQLHRLILHTEDEIERFFCSMTEGRLETLISDSQFNYQQTLSEQGIDNKLQSRESTTSRKRPTHKTKTQSYIKEEAQVAPQQVSKQSEKHQTRVTVNNKSVEVFHPIPTILLDCDSQIKCRLIFDQYKEYSNYFPRSNVGSILRNIQLNESIKGSKNLANFASHTYNSFNKIEIPLLKMVQNSRGRQDSNISL